MNILNAIMNLIPVLDKLINISEPEVMDIITNIEALIASHKKVALNAETKTEDNA